MGTLTGRQYMIAALKRQYADRPPVTVLVGPYCSRLAGFSVREILTDAGKSAKAHLAFFNRFEPDSLIVYNDVHLEAEAVGCRLEFPEDNISHPKAPLLDEPAKLADLRVPDPGKDGRLPYFFELLERVSSEVADSATIGLGHSGPWNLAVQLRGAETLLIETMTDPGFVRKLMAFTTEVVRAVGDALIDAGFAPSLGEASASCSLISPKIYREFIKPHHEELCTHFASRRARMSLHICGLVDPMMEDIIDTGIGLFSLDAPSNLKRFVELSEGKTAIMGNVPTGLFASGTKDEMELAIQRCIETAAGPSGYILASGCEIPLNSTEERIEHYFRYGRQYGRKYLETLKAGSPGFPAQ